MSYCKPKPDDFKLTKFEKGIIVVSIVLLIVIMLYNGVM